jgi:hypothetical protein
MSAIFSAADVHTCRPSWHDAIRCWIVSISSHFPHLSVGDIFILYRRELVAGMSCSTLYHVAFCSSVIGVVCYSLCSSSLWLVVSVLCAILAFLCPSLCNGIRVCISVSCMPLRFLCLFVFGCRVRLLHIGVKSPVCLELWLCMVVGRCSPLFSSMSSRFESWCFRFLVVL